MFNIFGSSEDGDNKPKPPTIPSDSSKKDSDEWEGPYKGLNFEFRKYILFFLGQGFDPRGLERAAKAAKELGMLLLPFYYHNIFL